VKSPSDGPPVKGARVLTDRGFRRERRLIDQIVAAAPGMAARLRRARGLSDACLRGERQQNLEDLSSAERARDSADAALTDREELLAVFGHDMRSLMSVLSVNAEMAAGESPNGPESLESFQRTVRQMDRLISNVLDLARLRAGKFNVVLDKRNASDLVGEAVDVFRPLASARSVSLEARLPESEIPVRVDPDRIFQVLSNLVSNAIKVTPRGGQISLSAARRDRHVQIAVQDTGRGIAETDLHRLFSPFCQLGRGDRNGLGLGLFISKSIVQAHGGTIWAESRVGSGSTFFFTVPAARQSPAEKTALDEATAN
jgi:signal transduction histidine kinase